MCPARAEAWPVRTQPVTPGGEALPRQAHCRGGGREGARRRDVVAGMSQASRPGQAWGPGEGGWRTPGDPQACSRPGCPDSGSDLCP